MLEAVPVVDLSPFDGSDAEDSRAVVVLVEQACRELGFFLVVGHGVGDSVQRGLYEEARAFFDLDESRKRALPSAGPVEGGLGFVPMESETLSATAGVAAPADLKESLNYGPRLGGASWPADRPALRSAFEAYFTAMEDLARRLRHVFCCAIGLTPDFFEADFTAHLSALRVINYPEPVGALQPGQFRAGAHTDYGFLTILRSEASSGGLEVQRRDGTWISVPAREGAFVINIGDAFMRWTNDDWVSTPHRVANPPRGGERGSRRQSIPFFSNPGRETTIRCLDRFCSFTRPARYEPVSYGDYIALKTRQAGI